MINVAYYLFNAFGISAQPSRLMLPKWANVSEEKFNEILSTVTKAKNNGLKINADGREVTVDNTESLLKSVGSEKINKSQFKKEYKNIANGVEKTLNRSMFTRNQIKMIKILSLLRGIVEGPLYEQLATTDMPELESEESAAQRINQQGQGLKILTPNQVLSRLPISLAKLKAGNNSEKLKNETRQILYSLHRSKMLTKQIYKSLIDII